MRLYNRDAYGFPSDESFLTIAEKYEVTVEDSVLDDLHRLPPVWEAYCALLVETTETLEAQKDRFRTGKNRSGDVLRSRIGVSLNRNIYVAVFSV